MLIAVDTNVLLDQADGDENVVDALATLRERLTNAQFIVPPTVLEELGHQLGSGDPEESKLAEIVLMNLLKWGYTPLNVVPVGKGITEQISLRLRMKGVLPDEELNDSYIIAESALLGCSILLSSDWHLLEAQEHNRFREVLKESDVDGDSLVIARPRTIVSKFFLRK